LVCDQNLWNQGTTELHKRTGGVRESGAFLLGKREEKCRRIIRFVYYDDLDIHCFDKGIVEFDGGKFGLLWEICRNEGLEVVADVHVHALGFGQSQSDRDHPMMPLAGHLAVILPNYAGKNTLPGRIGLYEYQGNAKWTDHSREGAEFFKLDKS
jgi:proteasome lid subunit RPN8/RPN11